MLICLCAFCLWLPPGHSSQESRHHGACGALFSLQPQTAQTQLKLENVSSVISTAIPCLFFFFLITSAHPPKQEAKKRTFMCCAFKAQQNVDDSDIKRGGKALCLSCNDPTAVLKVYVYINTTRLSTLQNNPSLQKSKSEKLHNFK